MPSVRVQAKDKRKKASRTENSQSRSGESDRYIAVSDLLQAVNYLDKNNVIQIEKAYRFSKEAHAGQERESGEAYIHHPLAVAHILADLHLDGRSIVAAILHDVIEDTSTARAQLVEKFGEDVAHLVDGVTKIGQIEFESTEHAEAENFHKMLLSMSRDIRVILIKLADRIHNMRTLDSLKVDKRRRIAQQTLEIFAPIANRLGLNTWTQELEDLSFQHLYPKRYDAIRKELVKRRGNHRKIVDNTQKRVTEELKKTGIKCTISGREKNLYRVYRKMQARHVPLSELRDVFAIRVVVDTVDDCYRSLGVIHNLYKPVPGKFKDYISIPKANGYQSLHTLLFGTFGQSIEVQIRTVDMHRIAEVGVAAHWRYKSSTVGQSTQQLTGAWLNDLLDGQAHSSNPAEFLEHLKTDLFPDEVYVFTPKGDIKKLPKGSTALDFAYAVHSDIGNHCVGAKVDHVMVPLHQTLNNGTHIEVLTTRSAYPSPMWLNYVITGKARSAIRAYLKHQSKEDAVKLGKQLLERALESFGINTRLKTRQKVELLGRIGKEDWTELLDDIGTGRRLPLVVAQQLSPDKDIRLPKKSRNQPLVIKGAEGMMVRYGQCCRPRPGDRIVGLFSRGTGIVIHSAKCSNTKRRGKTSDNWIPVAWADDVRGEFAVDIHLETTNRPGVLARLAAVIADENSNINKVSVTERDTRHATIRFTIGVESRQHLATIMKRLRARHSVIRISRSKG
jgi:RelA/SpoT family (p)ppGpp synthetase